MRTPPGERRARKPICSEGSQWMKKEEIWTWPSLRRGETVEGGEEGEKGSEEKEEIARGGATHRGGIH